MTIWISHRGLSHGLDDNTQTSFKLACEAGFSWLETDLHTTKDNHIVLCHDPEISYVSNSTGTIARMNRSELEKVLLNRGGTFLFLDEFMQEFSQQNWVFDIKPATVVQTMKVLKSILMSNRSLLKKITFLFWSAEQQALFLNDFPEAMCFPREEECYRAGITTLVGLSMFGRIKVNQIYSLTPKLLGRPLLNQRMVRGFHRRGAQVIGYLPETEHETQLCLNAGVDFILTNHSPLTN